MAKHQTRRTISVGRETYERLRAYCEERGIAMAATVEDLVLAEMDRVEAARAAAPAAEH